MDSLLVTGKGKIVQQSGLLPLGRMIGNNNGGIPIIKCL